MNKFIYYLIRYLRGIRLIIKASTQLKKYKVGSFLLYKYLTQSISIFVVRLILNKKIAKDFDQYVKRRCFFVFQL